jgi:hypothetical protein
MFFKRRSPEQERSRLRLRLRLDVGAPECNPDFDFILISFKSSGLQFSEVLKVPEGHPNTVLPYVIGSVRLIWQRTLVFEVHQGVWLVFLKIPTENCRLPFLKVNITFYKQCWHQPLLSHSLPLLLQKHQLHTVANAWAEGVADCKVLLGMPQCNGPLRRCLTAYCLCMRRERCLLRF